MDYSFLSNLTLKDTGRLRQPKTNTPEGLSIRILANGSVYPSAEAVERFGLEYTKKDEQNTRNGFDVVDSHEWEPTKALPRMILLGVTPKTEPKVELFAGCRYDDEGFPRSSVVTQGTVSETLLDLVRQMGYLTEDQKYCDLQIITTYPIKTEDNIAFVPKTIERGERKGEKTYERRENVTFFAVNTPENITAAATTQSTPVASTVSN
jgi:hypothetical protein